MDPDVFRALCQTRAKVERLRAIRLTLNSFAVPSRDESPGDFYTVVVNNSGQPVNCHMDGVLCKSFEYRGYCTHAGATENSIANRRRHPKREAMRGQRPVRKAELDGKARKRLVAQLEALEAAVEVEA